MWPGPESVVDYSPPLRREKDNAKTQRKTGHPIQTTAHRIRRRTDLGKKITQSRRGAEQENIQLPISNTKCPSSELRDRISTLEIGSSFAPGVPGFRLSCFLLPQVRIRSLAAPPSASLRRCVENSGKQPFGGFDPSKFSLLCVEFFGFPTVAARDGIQATSRPRPGSSGADAARPRASPCSERNSAGSAGDPRLRWERSIATAKDRSSPR